MDMRCQLHVPADLRRR